LLIRAGGDSAWRTVVRTGWLTAELALATDRPAAAVVSAERARAIATEARAVRHTVKSTLVLGVALTAGGTPDGRRRAECLLTAALTSSLDRGMLPLAWPCALLLAELAPDRAADLTKIASNALTSIFARSDARQRRLAAASPWFPAALARSGDPTRTGAELAT
jgi:hypothetical protein